VEGAEDVYEFDADLPSGLWDPELGIVAGDFDYTPPATSTSRELMR
jgi:hypothetical protein